MEEKITVLIPTYNRKEYLTQALRRLSEQTSEDFYIIVSDNASDYDVVEVVNEFENLAGRIEVLQRKVNVGADLNILNLFFLCKTKYAWIIADDDMVVNNAIEKIYSHISLNKEFGCINFSISADMPYKEDKIVINNIEDFADFYMQSYNNNSRWQGDLIFLSNKVYNMENIIEFIPWMTKYLYTKISTAVLIAKSVEGNNPYIVINDKIIEYNEINQRSWDPYYVLLGSRVLYDIPFDVSKKTLKKIMRGLSFGMKDVYFLSLVDSPENKNPYLFFDQIYHGLYKHILPLRGRIKLFIISRICRFYIGYRMMRIIFDYWYKMKYILYLKSIEK